MRKDCERGKDYGAYLEYHTWSISGMHSNCDHAGEILLDQEHPSRYSCIGFFMGKRLIVAEKPSVGRDIANVLNCRKMAMAAGSGKMIS